jgi:hypothetical protein
MNPYRNEMDLEPRTVKVDSEEHLKAQVEELQKQGRRIIDCNVFENGIVGKLAFWVPPEGKHLEKAWTPQDADAIWLTWEKFGKTLEPEKVRVIDGTQLFKLFNEHKSHQIVGFTNSMEKTAGFICFCKAAEGKSLVMFVHLADAKGIPPELLTMFSEPAAQVVDPKTRG